MSQETSISEAKTVGQLLGAHGQTLSTAESCTGGLIGDAITDIPGSSDYYRGGVIAYANEAKQNVLGVRPGTLAVLGAVSEETALQMARGARRLFGTDYALSVTGIAGPGGGTRQKPVGLVYIALVGPNVERAERHVWEGDRRANKRASARRALQMLIEHLRGGNRA
ncbi:MAG: CinA family protein [Anaerolineae bacterium]|jgi:PncC family amidohydrolase